MASEALVNIGSCNGLLPDNTKPLPAPMLTYHQWGPMTIIWEQFHKGYKPKPSMINISLKIYNLEFIHISQSQWVNGSRPLLCTGMTKSVMINSNFLIYQWFHSILMDQISSSKMANETLIKSDRTCRPKITDNLESQTVLYTKNTADQD